MERIGGVSVEELQGLGMCPEQIEYIRETAFTFKQKLTRSGTVAGNYGPAFVVEAFEQGLALGIAEAMRLSGVRRTIGLYWPTALAGICAPETGRAHRERRLDGD